MKNMANKIINVLIVDDEQIVREGLRYIIDWKPLLLRCPASAGPH